MSEQAILQRLCRGRASAQALATELSMDEPQVRACIASLREAGIGIDESGPHEFDLIDPVRLLDSGQILAALDEATRAQVQSLQIVFDSASTQDDALAAPVPNAGCAIFLAERQTAGQGRRGRVWTSPLAANLYMSLSRRFATTLPALSGLSLVVGVVVAESINAHLATALENRAPGALPNAPVASRVGVKWPNDLMVDGRKIGGILIQLRTAADGAVHAVIGVGINVRMPPQHGARIDQAWCDLQQLGLGDVSRSDLAASLLVRLLPALDQFERDGLSPFLARWNQLDSLVGKPVRILEAPDVHEGMSMGITESGALRVRQGQLERTFHSGEVSLRPA